MLALYCPLSSGHLLTIVSPSPYGVAEISGHAAAAGLQRVGVCPRMEARSSPAAW